VCVHSQPAACLRYVVPPPTTTGVDTTAAKRRVAAWLHVACFRLARRSVYAAGLGLLIAELRARVSTAEVRGRDACFAADADAAASTMRRSKCSVGSAL